MNRNLKQRSRILALGLSLMLAAGGLSPVYAAEKKDTSVSKEETVYVMAAQDGAADKIIVSEWLKNTGKRSLLKDYSELKDIENVKGDEAFTQKNGDGSWNAQGKDIYYQGRISKELPVQMRISYYLDDKKVSAKDLAGKSGKIRIRFDYTNNQKMDGVYVPFVLLTSMALDNEKCANVQVTNGKVVNDGQKSLVVGYALPGLSDSLKLNRSDVTIPDYVEVTCEARDFAMDGTMTVAASSLLEDLNLGNINSLDDLKAALDKLQSAAAKLQKGADKLQAGAGDLSRGTGRLYQGTKTLNTKVSQLSQGMRAAKAGTEALKAGSDKLQSGAQQLSGGAENLQGGLGQVSGGLDQAYENLMKTIGANEQVLAGLKRLPQEQQSALAQAIGTLEQTIAGQKQIAASMTKGGKLKEGVSRLQTGSAKLVSGSRDLKNGLVNLSSGAADLNTGIAAACKGSGLVEKATGQLAEGARKVNSGAGDLFTGSRDLADGISKFKTDGLDKLVAVFNGDVSKVVDRLKSLQKASEDYQNFAGKKADVQGSVKFVYKTDGIN